MEFFYEEGRERVERKKNQKKKKRNILFSKITLFIYQSLVQVKFSCEFC